VTDLRRLVAKYDLAERLSETEQNILRMAARNKSAQGIASLYGFPNARAAQQAVDRIVAKLQGTSALAGNVNGAGAAPKPSTGDSSQPRRPPREFDGRPLAPAHHTRADAERVEAKVLALARDCGEITSAAVRERLGIPKSSATKVLARLRDRRELHLKRVDGRTPVYGLGPGTAAREAACASQPTPKPREHRQTDWIDQFVNRQAVADEIERLRAVIAEATSELDRLEPLVSLLGGMGVL
jgi:hypothetical protein